MALVYPLSPPNGNFRSVELFGRQAAAVATSPTTYQQQVQRWTGERWEASFSLPRICDRAEAEAWVAFLLGLQGPFRTFRSGTPQSVTTMGTLVAEVVLANGLTAAGFSEVPLKGLPALQANVFRAGDLIEIEIAGHKSLHKVLQDVASAAGGVATIDIFPALRSDVPDDTVITYQNPLGTWRLDEDSLGGFTVDVLEQYGIDFRAIEVLPT